MNIRETNINDIPTIMKIYEEAKKFMIQNGNPNQWINGYPNSELLELDIQYGNSYVCVEQQNNSENIIATFCFIKGTEPTYAHIKGAWLNDTPYGVIHRIAVKAHYKNIGTFCLNWAMDQCKNIRIDTHHDNIPMRKTLEKNGYTYCGIITWEDGSERIAFQKTLL
ncbi:GNAT family N-acetyltransferase [Fusobacterium sp. PH5-44]|uniref:GNAT family N-acetyltransferase n=1 Tax=unclassified Fusobacterium TaxID=2648384 RepID=UPI003D1CD3F4